MQLYAAGNVKNENPQAVCTIRPGVCSIGKCFLAQVTGDNLSPIASCLAVWACTRYHVTSICRPTVKSDANYISLFVHCRWMGGSLEGVWGAALHSRGRGKQANLFAEIGQFLFRHCRNWRRPALIWQHRAVCSLPTLATWLCVCACRSYGLSSECEVLIIVYIRLLFEKIAALVCLCETFQKKLYSLAQNKMQMTINDR